MKQTVVSRPFKTKWEHDHLLKNNYYTCEHVFVMLQSTSYQYHHLSTASVVCILF